MKYNFLPLAGINFKDERFRTSYFFSLDRLILSIRKVGLLSPPIVRQSKNGFVLVTGWKRMLACRKLGLSPVSVLVTEKKDPLCLFLMAFYENLITREMSLVEKAEIVRKLLGFGVEKKLLLKDYLPLLSLPLTAAHLEVLLALSKAGAAVKEFIFEKNVPLPVVQSLLQFPSSERQLLLPLLRPLGQNKQREILEDIRETSRRDGISLRNILKDKEIQQALESVRLPPVQKAEKIRRSLKKRRYPRLSSWQEAFDSTLRKVRWPKEIVIQPSPYFESDDIAVSFRFKNEKEFRAGVGKLQEMAEKEELFQVLKR